MSLRFLRLLAFLPLVIHSRPVAADPPRPNIILITLDTTRADRMGFLGSTLGLTPHLDALAKQSVVFTRAYSHVPLTTASHATILSGTYPQFNGVNDFGKPIRPDLPYLPDLLHHHGYRTAAFVGALVLDPIGGTAPGFDRGFDTYDAGFRSRRHGEDRYHTLERRAGEVISRALSWLDNRPRQPFFLWIHLYDAHDPYDPPEPFATKFATSRYEGEIAYSDACVGKLLTALRRQGLFDNSLIAVMADHGEAFGEHGERSHGIFLYDETIHVPLLLKLPQNRNSASRIDGRVGLVDVAPTALQLAGIPIPGAVQGESLLSLVKPTASHVSSSHAQSAREGSTTQAIPAAGGSASVMDRPTYAETDYPRRAFGWSSLRSLRTGKYLYVSAPERELYDQTTDPAATHNLTGESPAVTDTLAAQIETFRARTSGAGTGNVSPGVNAQQAEQLAGLGYIASDTASSAATPDDGNRIDPKEKIKISNQLHDALLDVEEGRYAEAIPKLQLVLSDQPQISVAHMHLGTSLARLKRYREALPSLQKAVQLQPDSGMAHYELGLALFDTGDLQAAAPEFEFTVEHAPRWADAHFSLAAVYARIDRIPEAMTNLDAALELNSNHYRANLLRGRILALQGHAADALANLQKAAEAEPNSVEAHQFLSEAYEESGQQDAAKRERTAAERLKSVQQ